MFSYFLEIISKRYQNTKYFSSIKTKKINNSNLKSNNNITNMADSTADKLEFREIKTTELHENLLKNDKKLVPQFWVNKYKNEASKNWYYYCFKKNIYMYIYIKC